MLRPLTLHMLDVFHSHASLSGLSLHILVPAERQLQRVSNQLGPQSHTKPQTMKPANLLFASKWASCDPAAGAGGVTGDAVPRSKLSMLLRCS